VQRKAKMLIILNMELQILNDEKLQTELLKTWIQIISKSNKTSSLKYALARALLDVAKDNNDTAESIKVSKESLAERFIEYYWYLVLKFKLKQSGGNITAPNIVRMLKAKQEVISVVRRPKDAPEKIISEIRNQLSSNGFKEVLPRFHLIKGKNTTHKFYKTVKGGIEIEPKVIEFLYKYRAVLLDSIFHHWTLLLERLNSAPQIAGKIIYDANRRRNSLASFRKVLQLEEEPECFFCSSVIKGTPQVEHMLPHSYVFEDELWNLTLSCKDCNRAKWDYLPCSQLINKLVIRNQNILNSPNDPLHTKLKTSLLNLQYYPRLKMKDSIIRIRDNAELDGFTLWSRK
jgi:CRISPR/Cas system Type II protein with McrA/HNH and RuvC-like nuclease domain